MSEEHEIITLFRKVQLDLRDALVKMGELQRMVAALDLPDPTERTCDGCGATFKGPLSLAEHEYLSHDGPVPEHWLEAERLAGESEEAPRGKDAIGA